MILNVSDLRFRYNGKPVLEEIQFDLRPGELMAVLGVNGAGKSTLLKCLNRIIKPHAGLVTLNGRKVHKMSANDLACHFGYVPQHAGAESLTVFEAVLLGRKPHIKWSATPADLEVVDRVLQQMHLSDLAHRPASQLSGGEMQKVLIARALAQEPDILLLDEPTSNLDLKNQLQVMNLIVNAVRDQGIAAIISLHDVNLALRYADRFLLLKEGTIHSLGHAEMITPAALQAVYGVDVIISQVGNQTVVVPLETC